MTLVALFAMTAGAWADGATITLTSGQTVKTYEDVTLPWSTTAEILKEVVTDINFNININAISGGDGKVVKYGNENFTVTGTFSGDATVTVTYNMGSSATITVTAPAPLIALNDTKTEATMEMPGADVTVDYELVRDLTVQTQFYGVPTETVFVKKGDDKFMFADGVPTVALLDLLNQNAPIYDGVSYYFEKKNADTGEFEATTVNLLEDAQPGTWRIVTYAVADGPYDGTVRSDEFTLAEAYDLTLRPATNANLKSVTVGDEAVTPTDGKIKNIEPAKKVKITTTGPDYIIRKATVKKKVKTYTITPRNQRVSYDYGNLTNEATLPYNITTSELMKKVGLSSVNNSYNIQSVSLTSGSNVTLGTPTGTPGERGYEVPLTITGEGEFVLTIGRTNNNNDALIKVIVSANSDN